eukprot:Gregarina_sp_Pseudo_9__710@NODE_1451_length_1587_cov_16_846253_g1348_i0_p1_GENE_NODE_1451_length_1587_cov_16_846253_g1348_i0NODE_1451_length_1587_cov_16_846253_g1348_i0_p1_ORF_typecomplete_len464_score19_33IIGP/PF05049_13/6_1e33RsgA_GTPase/PF03193_16/0_00071RsgA_GTPase/PF03193_16/2_4e02MMR_HSR1/PF01926_23/0_00012ABC_tran/PF00005_27/5e03ABC_tran/PF00005_27/0_00089Dynamin_N/PF00350_23/0_012FeoB_N/PF02421_18/0_0023AIG1/PF04548_16/0_031PduVEutP/PF10662_9/5_4PduVEutP/PF10662_9/17GBP/PF02263_19/0_043A
MSEEDQRKLARCLCDCTSLLLAGPVGLPGLAQLERRVLDSIREFRSALMPPGQPSPPLKAIASPVGSETPSPRNEASQHKKLQKLEQETAVLYQEHAAAQHRLNELQGQAGRHVLIAGHPSKETLEAKRYELYGLAFSVSHYAENFAYVAVVGAIGTGKSSLINSVRGLRKRDSGAAPVKSYGLSGKDDSRRLVAYSAPKNSLIFFEVPGFGDMDNLRWNFFEDQSLFAYDAVVLLWESRLTDTDSSIIANSLSLNVPLMLVRTKADSDIKNQQEDAKGNLENVMRDYRSSTQKYVTEQLKQLPKSIEISGARIKSFILSERSLLRVVQQSRRDVAETDERIFLDALRQVQPRVRVESQRPRLPFEQNVHSPGWVNRTTEWGHNPQVQVLTRESPGHHPQRNLSAPNTGDCSTSFAEPSTTPPAYSMQCPVPNATQNYSTQWPVYFDAQGHPIITTQTLVPHN